MRWRVVVELSGTIGAVQMHEVHVGGSAMVCSAAMLRLRLTLAEANRVLAGLQRRAGRSGQRRPAACIDRRVSLTDERG
jgi:hypothetical protein